MAIETTIESIKENGYEKLIKRDQDLIREALESTEFKFDGFIWVTEDNDLDIVYWITYEVDTIFSASILAPFVEKLLELKADSINDNRVRNLADEALVDIAFDLRYAKGTGSVDMYQRMLSKNGFIVFDPSVQIERICHTVKTEMEFRMQE
ncbi:hypothetical protein [uncultured Methanobrevibacter sp.]|uniref:hypothetical protein n=1 Tax=uncultured Methanobrevibacter sp. TaxID=253161 RepID=UPI0025DB535E|nr:hypothetical protein [uncultured Methanobrevibacter sp.]